MARRETGQRTSTSIRWGSRPPLLAEALFPPGVGVVVVAVALPEAQAVVVQELQAADPLGALPEVALRARSAAADSRAPGSSGSPVVGVGEQHVVVVQDRRAACWPCSPARQWARTCVAVGPDAGQLQDRPDRRRPPSACPASTSGSRSGCPSSTCLRGSARNWSQVSVQRAVHLAEDPEVPRRQVRPWARSRSGGPGTSRSGTGRAGSRSRDRGVGAAVAEEAIEHAWSPAALTASALVGLRAVAGSRRRAHGPADRDRYAS